MIVIVLPPIVTVAVAPGLCWAEARLAAPRSAPIEMQIKRSFMSGSLLVLTRIAVLAS